MWRGVGVLAVVEAGVGASGEAGVGAWVGQRVGSGGGTWSKSTCASYWSLSSASTSLDVNFSVETWLVGGMV